MGLVALTAIIGSPVIIFSATPRMPLWYKSGRIVFLWLCAVMISAIFLYTTLNDPKNIEHWGIKEQAYSHYTFLAIWYVFLTNVYIGFFEFLWRCIYRQWSWPPLKNLQYGLVSNLCVVGSALLIIPVIYILIVVSIIKIVY